MYRHYRHQKRHAGSIVKARVITSSILLLASSHCMAGLLDLDLPESLKNLKDINQVIQRLDPNSPPKNDGVATSAGQRPQLRPSPPLSPAAAAEIKRYRVLLAKGTVTGTDLLDTIKALRRDLHNERNARATAQLALAIDHSAKAVTTPESFSLKSLWKAISDAVLTHIKSEANDFAFKTLDDHLQVLFDDPSLALAEQKVAVPRPDGLSDMQVKRNVTLAALVVTARLSNEVLKKAEADFKSLSTDYQTLLDQREKAAELLFSAIDQRRAAAQGGEGSNKNADDAALKSGLSEQDLQFIDTKLSQMPLREFAKDMAAQNLALKYLSTKNPAASKQYNTLAGDVVQRTRAYIRTVSGLAAFGAMAMSFAHEMSAVADENSVDSVLDATPLALEFVKAAEPAALKAITVSVNGVAVPAVKSTATRSVGSYFSSPDMFTVGMNKETRSVSGAKDVFGHLKEAHMSDPFADRLFSTDSLGWLNRIKVCDPVQIGQMVDTAVPRAERAAFAKSYFGWSDTSRIEQFNFTNAFEENPKLADDLLGGDQRKRAKSLPMAAVQKSIAQNYTAWNTQQLLQLIFSNRESSAAYAALEFDGMRVKAIPSAEAVYAYESRVDSCGKASAAADSPPPRNATPTQQASPRPGKRVGV